MGWNGRRVGRREGGKRESGSKEKIEVLDWVVIREKRMAKSIRRNNKIRLSHLTYR